MEMIALTVRIKETHSPTHNNDLQNRILIILKSYRRKICVNFSSRPSTLIRQSLPVLLIHSRRIKVI
jgi:hypothetical protein